MMKVSLDLCMQFGGTGHRDDGWNLALDKLFRESKTQWAEQGTR